MRNRGQIYWSWVDPTVHSRNHDERLSSGVLLNIQVRLSKTNQTQLFVGAYDQSGLMIFEESYLERPGQTMTQALAWGLDLGRQRAGATVPLRDAIKKGRDQRPL